MKERERSADRFVWKAGDIEVFSDGRHEPTTPRPPDEPRWVPSAEFYRAIAFAVGLHAHDARQNAQRDPYLTHLLAVAALVVEDGGSQEETVAALLHDAAEDHPITFPGADANGGVRRVEQIRCDFGETVARIVEGCSDTLVRPKPPWAQRKRAYIARLAQEPAETRRVSLADDEYTPEREWSPVMDLRAAKAAVRARCGDGVRISLVGCSLGGHAVLASSFEGDVDAVVSVSAPVQPVSDELSRRVSGRKLYLCASDDHGGATPLVLASFAALERPKELRVFDGTEHSIGMFKAAYGPRVIAVIVEFTCPPA